MFPLENHASGVWQHQDEVVLPLAEAMEHAADHVLVHARVRSQRAEAVLVVLLEEALQATWPAKLKDVVVVVVVAAAAAAVEAEAESAVVAVVVAVAVV